MSEPTDDRLLAHIASPADLRKLPPQALPRLAAEIRAKLIATMAAVGGHFAASLGTVELTLALHRALDTPNDRLIWDIGHQTHAHKMLTGRRAALATQRARGGLAPFLSRFESPYDAFGAGHAGTSISAAAGMAIAALALAQRRRVVAVIGDGGLTAGMAFEALNHIGGAQLNILVVLNDNGMSISENVGALTAEPAVATEKPGAAVDRFFTALGFAYSGPIDGHDLDALHTAIESVKDAIGPQLLHVRTIKGRGYAAAEADPVAWHGVMKFDAAAAVFSTAPSPTRSYSQVFGDWLCSAAVQDPRIVAITPAMREGSGLVEFAERFPRRYFDVGIAEQHAVTLAAGMAAEGLRPVVAIYSTFLQRAMDQLIHDVAIQGLAVLFAIDRAGLVGPDGTTHQGVFDIALLRMVPGLIVMAPSSAAECERMLTFGIASDSPCALRYPRGPAYQAADAESAAVPVSLGRGLLLRRSENPGHGELPSPRIALLAFGTMLAAALEAGEALNASVADMRFAKPLDEALIFELARDHQLLVTIEDGAITGGAGNGVDAVLIAQGLQRQVLNLGVPDHFIEHATRDQQLAQCGLDATGILDSIRKILSGG